MLAVRRSTCGGGKSSNAAWPWGCAESSGGGSGQPRGLPGHGPHWKSWPKPWHNPDLPARAAAAPPPKPRAPLQVNEGVVLAVGPGRRNRDGDLVPASVKEGDRVLLPEFGGSPVKLNDKE